MTYIYDILLNFNQDFYEFYEWEKGDYLTLIKKIPIYKVKSSFLEDVLTKKIKIDDPFTLEIMNKCEIIENKKVKQLKYACLITDGYKVLAISLNNNLEIFKVSDLLLDEASDVLAISKGYKIREIAYNTKGEKNNYNFLTRKEIKIKKYLKEELKNAYLNNQEKLKYLYFEYFNKNPIDINTAYQELITSLIREINVNHLKLYELVKLAHNLTK